MFESYISSKYVQYSIMLSHLFAEMSVVHSPHFDWVVVHVGSSFPETVINKVLSCGIKDFCNHEQGKEVSWFSPFSPG